MTYQSLQNLDGLISAGLDIRQGPANLEDPVSQACTQTQMESDIYKSWCSKIKELPKMHRKQWEFVYILQVLSMHSMVGEGKSGLGFGVGEEPLAAYFASQGAKILATDLEPSRASEAGWVATDQHAASKESLNSRRICPPEAFEKLVEFRFMDMNHIDLQLQESFDFCWSACALEHLGSIQHGLSFIENSIQCLKPGGIAVHTTEFNCHSNNSTLDDASTVLFRRRDFQHLARRLQRKGCQIILNFDLGNLPLDQYYDLPPYSFDRHLKLRIAEWTTTSFGFVVKKN